VADSDFNPSTDTICVRHNKSAQGIRDICISPDESGHLSTHLSGREPHLSTPDSPLFSSPECHRLNHSNFRRQYELALALAGIEGVTFHDLRRTHATALVAHGFDPKVVQERMGHASIQTTLGLYAQATQDGLRNAAFVMGAYLSTSTADRH